MSWFSTCVCCHAEQVSKLYTSHTTHESVCFYALDPHFEKQTSFFPRHPPQPSPPPTPYCLREQNRTLACACFFSPLSHLETNAIRVVSQSLEENIAELYERPERIFTSGLSGTRAHKPKRGSKVLQTELKNPPLKYRTRSPSRDFPEEWEARLIHHSLRRRRVF